ncbi:MAG: carbohydrate ABC transporter permease [Sphaerochaetaceae bacterium]|jgi:ABC-type glycerol-3-phosphate transport system permease component|nr:carbohydrate ABC transporter permease [Sphaerochaetaceae bacterium]
MMTIKKKNITKEIFVYLIFIILSAIFLFPIYWTFITAFKPSAEILKYPPRLIPATCTLDQFNKLFTAGNGVFLQYIKNTVIITIGTILLVLFIIIPCSFSFALLPYKGQKIIFILVLSIIMVPFQSLLVPLYNLLTKLKLFNTKIGIILIYSTFFMPFCIFMMRNAFKQLPKAIYESALLDGAGDFMIMMKIYLPLCIPSVVSCIIYLFINGWNDFILSFIFSSSDKVRNIQVGINLFGKERFTSDWGIINTGTVIAIIPTVILFIILQKYYVQGMTTGAVKE